LELFWLTCFLLIHSFTFPFPSFSAMLLNSMPFTNEMVTSRDCTLQSQSYCEYAGQLSTCCPPCSVNGTIVMDCSLQAFPELTAECPNLADCNSGDTNPGAGAASSAVSRKNMYVGNSFVSMFLGLGSSFLVVVGVLVL